MITKNWSQKIDFKNLRTRIAPSPTGVLHIGTARTALFNFLIARHYGGKFILRIEDTDLKRSEKKYEKDIVENLMWLGILPDEGPHIGGNSGPYRQTERIEIYETYIKKLLDEKKAFWCFHSKKELEEEKKGQLLQKTPQRHTCSFRNLKEIKKRKGIIRLKTPEKIIKFFDVLKGEMIFDGSLLGDVSIAKDLRTPLYNFAVVVDDYLMKINWVIRGEDHLSNTPKQILIQEALGFNKVNYLHLPLILDPERKKLSKRFGATSVASFKEDGYLPEAIINFLALLGWNPGTDQEIFSKDDLIQNFFVEGLQPSPAVFNIDKLNWLNKHYIKNLDSDKFFDIAFPYLKKKKIFFAKGESASGGKHIFSAKQLKKIVILEKERISKFSEIGDNIDFFFVKKLDYSKDLLIWQKMSTNDLKKVLAELQKIISKISKKDFNFKNVSEILLEKAKKFPNRGFLLWPLRVALSGKKASPGPFEIMELIGKKETLQRLKIAEKKIK